MQSPFDALISKFHEISPYDGFDSSNFEEDLQGWGSYSPVFESIIKNHQPKVIIEVGTWKGASAIHMSKLLKNNGISAVIFCVDTWLGDSSHWYRTEWRSHLKLKNGFPNLYYQFLANVMKHNHDDIIIPIPQVSRSACNWFKKLELIPDVVYLDGSHDQFDVYLDCHDYWQLLDNNGIMFGDDYGGIKNQGVKLAVDKFCEELGRKPTIIENKWILTKKKL